MNEVVLQKLKCLDNIHILETDTQQYHVFEQTPNLSRAHDIEALFCPISKE